ncbi:MAG: TonB C-terminal domain-containing protein [Acidobacteria bacterium]|nr:TonB C-terminal domain-containing protein [Acidobacteriota bacterium]
MSAVLTERAVDPAGLGRMLTLAVVCHALFLASVVVAPRSWIGDRGEEQLRTVMTISLGGATGPKTGGMTPIGGRPIQEAAPAAARPEPVRPPAPKPPEMTLPSPRDKVVVKPRPAPASAPHDAKGRSTTKGAEPRPGSTTAETGSKIPGFGLSSGGGGGTGGYLDVGNFCCPEYLATMIELIHRYWNSKQDVSGETMVRFTILRDGRLVDVVVERSSGYTALDLSAQRALLTARQLPPLPNAFTEDHLTVHLNFQYLR